MTTIPVHHLAFVFGILGNLVSFFVYLAPLPTFYRIIKKRSTEGFQSIPYSVALFSAMLMLYYAFVKSNDVIILITINSTGCFIETMYLTVYLIFATRKARIYTTKLLVLFNFGAYGLILVTTMTLVSDHTLLLKIVGWICVVFSVCVFAAPLSIMRLVIRTKSVEYMPFALSLSLTISAVMWFFYGFLLKDWFVAAPNILGFTFGIAQMILYILYKNYKKNELILPEFNVQGGISKNVTDQFNNNNNNNTEKIKANNTSKDANKNKSNEEENN